MLDDLLELALDLLGDLAEVGLESVGKKKKPAGSRPKRAERPGGRKSEQDPWERKQEKPPWEG